MANNRVAQFMSMNEESFSNVAILSPGYDIEKGLSASMLRYAARSVSELEDRVADVEDRVADAKAQLEEIHTEYENIKQKINELERRIIRVKTSMEGAMGLVKLFTCKHLEKIKFMCLGWADNEYRFLFITAADAFDWDFSDALAELEIALLQDYPDLPFSCKCIPSSVADDLTAILEHKFATLNPTKPKSTENVSSDLPHVRWTRYL